MKKLARWRKGAKEPGGVETEKRDTRFFGQMTL
jgi:hypothetical protein